MDFSTFDTTELDQFIGDLQRFGRTRTMICFSSQVEHREIYACPEEEEE